MTNSNLLIIGLLIIIIILLIVVLMKKTTGNPASERSDNRLAKTPNDLQPSSNSNELQLSSVDEIILQNSLGQEITFSRPSELNETKYIEVDIHGTGNIIQHVGQGAVDVYTLQEINSIAGTELYTSPIPLSELVENYSYKDGTLSSIHFKGKSTPHQGYSPFDSSSLAGIKPAIITAAAMQGMAVISGQYYLKQINKSLKALGKEIEELKEIHESNARGTLRHCRKRLMQITQMQHCSETDIMEIRDLANKAGIILEQYRDRYETALKEVENYRFEAFLVDTAIKEYNGKVAKLRYLLQVCMVADRIVDEARLAEFVTRRKTDMNDPKIEDVFNLMEENYHNGFNAQMRMQSSELAQMVKDKGRYIIDCTIDPLPNMKLLDPINKSAEDIECDIIDITGCVRRIEENQNRLEHVGLLLSEKGDEPRFFVEIPIEVEPERLS